MMSKFFSITIFAVLLISLALPQLVLARGLVPCGGEGEPKCNICHLFQLLQKIINGASISLLALAALSIVIGGIVILSSVGSPDRISQGKKMITYAIIGIVVCFGAWIIINTVMNALVNQEKMPWPWSKIQCVPSESITPPPSPPPPPVGKYCVCETPVYDLDPNSFPSEASIIGTNAKVTSLSSQQECLQKCAAANASTYCRSSLKPHTALYCTNDTELKNKSACTLNVLTANCQIASTCFNGESECLNAASTTYKKRCYLDGQFLCTCYKGSQKALCGNSTTQYVLYRIKEERSPGGTSLFDCNNAFPYYCRLDCKYDKCQEEKTNWCDEVKSSFSCFGSFTCKNMTTSQEGDACEQLKKFLNCMGSKNMPAGAKEISSISDNSKYKCFDTSYWNSKVQCSGTTDSCTGDCCGHSKYSLHYGGKPPGEGGVVGCRTCSWAIDFANEQYYQGIKNVAEVCADELNYGKVDVINEGNHIHVELEGVAKDLRCL